MKQSAEGLTPVDPYELREMSRRLIDVGEVVLSVAGGHKLIHGIRVEVIKGDKRTEVPIRASGDVWESGWKAFWDYEEDEQPRAA